jgi:hypothetical protein
MALAEPAVDIVAHLTGGNYGKVDTNITVTATEQKAFHFHSDVQGGGTWYDAFISVKDGTVTIVERDSVSGPYKKGETVVTTERIYRLPADKIANDEVQLAHGNRIVLTRGTNQSTASGSAVTVALMGTATGMAADIKLPVREPDEVVRALITAARENKLAEFLDGIDIVKVTTQPRHGMSQDRLLAFLKGIDLEKMKLTGVDQSSAKPAARVSLVEPISMDFDLEQQVCQDDHKTTRWVVLSIHP